MNIEFRDRISFHEKASSGSRDVLYGRTDGRRERDKQTKLIVAFRNFAKAPNKEEKCFTEQFFQAAILLPFIHDMPDWNLGPITEYPKGCFVSSVRLSKQVTGLYLKLYISTNICQ
jgi:hypothetical protein